jgi:glutaconate CoA-transferase subunit A
MPPGETGVPWSDHVATAVEGGVAALVLSDGRAEYLTVDPDGFREWVREHKNRAMVPKLMSEKDAVERFVQDGDYIVYECDYLHRGPSNLIREVIRQRKKDLWLGGKFTYVDATLLAGGGCISKADVGFFFTGPLIQKMEREGVLKLYEYSNTVMTNRIMAGAMGLPFIAVRSLGGTDGFNHSGAKLISDPYTHKPIAIVPALNPDVALIKVHQADIFGNARVFGTGISHAEAALASKKVILSVEEIIGTDEIRRDPGRTTIPYYVVDAVVHRPYGSYPGEMQGVYASDTEHVMEVMTGTVQGPVDSYLQKWVYNCSSDSEMLDRLVGTEKLAGLRRRTTITDGYRP